MNKNIDIEELKQLFNKIKQNDKKAYEQLYENYYKLVYGIAFSILKNASDSEDIVQLVFTKIYEMDKDKLPNDKEASWIYSLTKNEAISLIRKRNDSINLDNIYEIEDNDDYINKVIDKQTYNKLISKLNDREKQIISLKILSDLSFEEIANLINEPIGTVKWRYYKIIHSLKIFLSNLTMFFISFVIGIKNIFKKEVYVQDNLTNETTDKEQRPSDEGYDEYDKKEDILQDKDDVKEEGKNETIIQKPIEDNITRYNLGILAISGIFLIFTIISLISFIKYQLNLKKKTSK